jgi:hypothetical protein
MGEEELKELADDITVNGLQNPIVLNHDGTVLIDGRNRWLACDDKQGHRSHPAKASAQRPMNDRWSALRQTLKNRLPRFMGADLKVTAHMPAAAEVKRGPNRRQSKFEKFHETNPHVYELLVQLAREYIRRTGQRKLGIGML